MHRWFENQLASAVTWALWRRRGKLEGKALHLHVDAQTRTFGRAVCFWEVTQGLEKIRQRQPCRWELWNFGEASEWMQNFEVVSVEKTLGLRFGVFCGTHKLQQRTKNTHKVKYFLCVLAQQCLISLGDKTWVEIFSFLFRKVTTMRKQLEVLKASCLKMITPLGVWGHVSSGSIGVGSARLG